MPSNPNFVGGKLAELLAAANNITGGDKINATANATADAINNDITGGDRDATTTEFFNEINKKNNFYMNSHWVPSHDQPPQISAKYAKMF